MDALHIEIEIDQIAGSGGGLVEQRGKPGVAAIAGRLRRGGHLRAGEVVIAAKVVPKEQRVHGLATGAAEVSGGALGDRARAMAAAT